LPILQIFADLKLFKSKQIRNSKLSNRKEIKKKNRKKKEKKAGGYHFGPAWETAHGPPSILSRTGTKHPHGTDMQAPHVRPSF
jgi:hypothetical protein